MNIVVIRNRLGRRCIYCERVMIRFFSVTACVDGEAIIQAYDTCPACRRRWRIVAVARLDGRDVFLNRWHRFCSQYAGRG